MEKEQLLKNKGEIVRLLLLLLVLFSSCSSAVLKSELKAQEVFDITRWEMQDHLVAVGEVASLRLPLDYPDHLKVKCDGKEAMLGIFQDYKVAFISVDYSDKIGRHIICKTSLNKKSYVVARYVVVKKEFPSERLNVDRRRVFLSKKDRRRVAREQVFLNSNYFNPSEVALFKNEFMAPLDSYITSIYGSRRVFNKKKFSKHLGTDYRAAIGTTIPAANSGRVVVSRDLFYTGQTVTIDHGLGIFTVYGHLSKLLVKEGDLVEKGQTVALSGNTGRTSGPHLHWGIKIHNRYIDGYSLIAATKNL
jgi:murein DD-endopeptidase MepM/ murein hydrolase activator NlpD